MDAKPFARLLSAELLQRHAEIVAAAHKKSEAARHEQDAADHALAVALNNEAAAKRFILENTP
jgi:hypothetical protein